MARRIRCKVCNTLHDRTERCWHCKYEAAAQAEIDRINATPHMFPMIEGLLPGGQLIKYAYKGCPGVWCVTGDGNHWCGVSEAVPCNSTDLSELEHWYQVYPRLIRSPLWARTTLDKREQLFKRARTIHVRNHSA